MPVTHRHDQRVGRPHLPMQKSNSIVLIIIGPEGIRTHQFGQPIGLMRVSASNRSHFVDNYLYVSTGCLPSRLRSCHATADYVK